MAELPIACSNMPFLKKVVTNDGKRIGQVFNPTDPRNIAEIVQIVASDGKIRSDMKANLREARKIYTWENEEKKFMAVYDSLQG